MTFEAEVRGQGSVIHHFTGLNFCRNVTYKEIKEVLMTGQRWSGRHGYSPADACVVACHSDR